MLGLVCLSVSPQPPLLPPPPPPPAGASAQGFCDCTETVESFYSLWTVVAIPVAAIWLRKPLKQQRVYKLARTQGILFVYPRDYGNFRNSHLNCTKLGGMEVRWASPYGRGSIPTAVGHSRRPWVFPDLVLLRQRIWPIF